MDVLSSYRFRVEPGRQMQMVERRSLLETAPERVRRWPWMPACDRVGCASAFIKERDQERGTITIDVASSGRYERDVDMVFACASADGQLVEGAPLIRFVMPEANQGTTSRIILRRDDENALKRRWVQRSGQCHSLALLDINPTLQGRLGYEVIAPLPAPKASARPASEAAPPQSTISPIAD